MTGVTHHKVELSLMVGMTVVVNEMTSQFSTSL
jgi:hypothetical protein